MKKMLNAFALSAVLALGLTAGSLGQAQAGIAARDTATASQARNDGKVVDVQYRHHRHHRHHRPGRHHRHYRGGSGFFFGFGTPYYVNPPVYVRPRYVAPAYRGLSRAHIRWCYNRYRSYRASDNTFQPYHGPRRQCYSPY